VVQLTNALDRGENPVNIHAQLLDDCHYLGRLPQSALLLHRNASLPWFIVVPDTSIEDILDLPEHHRHAVLGECAAVSAYIKQVLGYSKVNFAGLGNVVPQMHLHVIGRHPEDACWPHPVWGNLEQSETYAGEQLRDWQSGLEKIAGLVPGSRPA
jgi:diadenosine tetraphosphate (Ap4A) HIT family hydrolase